MQTPKCWLGLALFGLVFASPVSASPKVHSGDLSVGLAITPNVIKVAAYGSDDRKPRPETDDLSVFDQAAGRLWCMPSKLVKSAAVPDRAWLKRQPATLWSATLVFEKDIALVSRHIFFYQNIDYGKDLSCFFEHMKSGQISPVDYVKYPLPSVGADVKENEKESALADKLFDYALVRLKSPIESSSPIPADRFVYRLDTGRSGYEIAVVSNLPDKSSDKEYEPRMVRCKILTRQESWLDTDCDLGPNDDGSIVLSEVWGNYKIVGVVRGTLNYGSVSKNVVNLFSDQFRGTARDLLPDRLSDLPNGDAYQLYQRALRDAESGSVEAALKQLDQAILSHPTYSAAIKARGNLREKRGNLFDALKDFERAQALVPSDKALTEKVTALRSVLAGGFVPAPSVATKVARDSPPVTVADKAAEPQVAPRVDDAATVSTDRTRLALVIGNAQYDGLLKLSTPRADAEAVSAKLRSKGFDVYQAIDANRRQMITSFNTFINKITKDAEVFVYYGGHGVELGGANYLLPTDMPAFARLSEELIKQDAVNLNTLLIEIGRRESGATVVILDACRNNPFRDMQVASLTRSVDSKTGLAPIAAPRGVFVMYSAGVNEEALDNTGVGDGDPNSLFARKLLPLMDQKGLEIRSMATRLRREVSTSARLVKERDPAGHRQSPATYDQMDGDFFFTPP